jgi:hypothetical protein
MLVRDDYVDSRDKQLHDDGSHQVVSHAEGRIQSLFSLNQFFSSS